MTDLFTATDGPGDRPEGDRTEGDPTEGDRTEGDRTEGGRTEGGRPDASGAGGGRPGGASAGAVPRDPRASLPQVDAVVRTLPELVAELGRDRVTAAVRDELTDLRRHLAVAAGDAGAPAEADDRDPDGAPPEAVDRDADGAPRETEDDTTHQAPAEADDRDPDGAPAEAAGDVPGVEEVAAGAARRLRAEAADALVAVVNATGVVLHTGLGRAPLSAAAREAAQVAAGYSNVELDLATGERGSRTRHVGSLAAQACGTDAATVVNNGAGALLLVLAALAGGREVIVSRGELVEIGGSYRLPDVMAAAGVRLVEVGTTNRTRLADHRAAITTDTGLLLKVHRSNFAIVGFTEDASLSDLVALGRERDLPVVHDLGSGLLRDAPPGSPLAGEPSVAASVAAGADLVVISGDKLLGGPQAGIIAGRADLVAACASHPLARALRIDALQRGALEATLAAHLREPVPTDLPTVAMLHTSADELHSRAERLADALNTAGSAAGAARSDGAGTAAGAARSAGAGAARSAGAGAARSAGAGAARSAGAGAAGSAASGAARSDGSDAGGSGDLGAEVVPTTGRVGGGSVPTRELPSWGVALDGPADALAAALRRGTPPVLGRIVDGRVVLDLRTVPPAGDAQLAELVAAARRRTAATGRDGAATGQGEVAPGRDGAATGQGEVAPGRDGAATGQGEVAPGRDGAATGRGEVAPGRDGAAIGRGEP